MKLVQDLIVFDLITTGLDAEKDVAIQVAAVLLDKDNMIEKFTFNAYVKVSLLESNLRKHADICGVNLEVFQKAKKTHDVALEFAKSFSPNSTLATSHPVNLFFFRSLFKKAAIPFPYSYNSLDIWTLGYDLALKQGWDKIPSLESLALYIKRPLSLPNNALERARKTAEFLRQHWGLKYSV